MTMSAEVDIARLQAEMIAVHRELTEARREIEELKADRKSMFKTGIFVLGTAVVTLAGIVWRMKFQ